MFVNLSTPPFEASHPSRIYEAEKDKNNAKSKTRVESGTQSHGVLRPPGVGTSFDMIVENIADHGPDREIETSRRRYPRHSTENDREVDFADETVPLVAAIQPQRDWKNGANRETPNKYAVNGVRAEKLIHTDYSPKNRPVEMNPGDRTSESIHGLRGAKTTNICEHPIEDPNLCERGNKGGNNLNREHDAWWNFHVVAQFQIRGKLNALSGGDVAVSDEYHIGNGTAGKDGATHKLTDEVNRRMLVRYRHYDTVGNEEDRSDAQRE